MNLRQIASGVAAGYFAKAIQMTTTVLLVPYLLRDNVLGVADYGRAFAILGIPTTLGAATAGVTLAMDRTIAQNIGLKADGQPQPIAEIMGAGTKFLCLAACVLLIPAVAFDSTILGWLSIPAAADYRGAMLAAVAISLIEHALYLTRAPLLARGDITFVNLVGMAETLARTLAIVFTFSFYSPSITALFGIQAIFTLARQVAFLFRLQESDLDGFWRAKISSIYPTIRYSGSITLTEGASMLVRNLPVIISAKFLGPAEAGYIALVVNTIQRYLITVLVAVVQPIAIPIASRFRMTEASESRIRALIDIDSAYAGLVLISSGLLVLWAPDLISLWLGPEFSAITFPTQLIIAGCAFEVSNMIRRSLLTGQGALPDAVPTTLVAAVIATILVTIGIVLLESWEAPVLVCAGFLVVVNTLGIDRAFSRLLPVPTRNPRFSKQIGSLMVFGFAISISANRWSDGWFGYLTWSAISLSVITGIVFLTIISPRRIWTLTRQLYRVRDAGLFS